MLRTTCLLALIALSYARSTYYAELEGRVVNGTDAPPGKYPFMVSYRALNSHSCGGTILNENWVLTAGHCVNGDNVNRISILSGTVDLEVGGTRHDAAELILHPDYSGATTRNDIALVRVVQPFVWDSMTAPVALPVQGQITDGGMNATLTGWGLPYTGGSVMRYLQEVDYWTVSDQECKDAHQNIVFETNICAYYPGGGKGQCSGDSGGPLLVNGEQVGIVSWSEKPCTIAPYPGVFTEVSAYIDWINQYINQF